ncbi:hypothetical protein BJY04DRAFT_213450 [Aspergillus karnatakaensis]|uniref:YdeI/OmpD-associated family protein n=1 Tax=Aspergillus karnatakaensis TaxID=1810916 RepID=UPI003CCDC736
MSTAPKPLPTDLPTHTFPSATDFESFLETNHTTLPGFYLKLAKKSSGIPSITSSEAVIVALCFGWIDGRAQSIDSDYWIVRYTPRRAKSMWSAKNVGTITELMAQGRVREKGLQAVEAAKADGRWGRAYDGPANIEVPGDLEAALKGDGKARETFEGLNRTERYWVLHPLQVGAESTRGERVKSVVEMLARGEVPGSTGSKWKDGKRSFKVEKTTAKATVKGKAKTKTRVEQEAVVKVSKNVENIAVSQNTSTRQLRSRRPRH